MNKRKIVDSSNGGSSKKTSKKDLSDKDKIALLERNFQLCETKRKQWEEGFNNWKKHAERLEKENNQLQNENNQLKKRLHKQDPPTPGKGKKWRDMYSFTNKRSLETIKT